MDIKIPLTIKLTKDNNSKSAPWVSYTPELDIASCGPTPAKAKKNLNEAIQIILKGAAEDGTLEDLLVESGFEVNRSGGVKPPKVSFDKLSIKLDYNLARHVWQG
jgi:predicted RNase H-like HicB family nuclease